VTTKQRAEEKEGVTKEWRGKGRGKRVKRVWSHVGRGRMKSSYADEYGKGTERIPPTDGKVEKQGMREKGRGPKGMTMRGRGKEQA